MGICIYLYNSLYMWELFVFFLKTTIYIYIYPAMDADSFKQTARAKALQKSVCTCHIKPHWRRIHIILHTWKTCPWWKAKGRHMHIAMPAGELCVRDLAGLCVCVSGSQNHIISTRAPPCFEFMCLYIYIYIPYIRYIHMFLMYIR